MDQVLTLPERYQPVQNLKTRSETEQWLRQNYHRLENGGFEYLGSEPNADRFTPEAWAKAKLRVLIARLSTYCAVDCSMTHSLLHQIIHQDENGQHIFADLTFLPPHKDYEAFVDAKISPWFGLTSKMPLRAFDLVVVSHSICMERLNYPRLLKLGGVPLFKSLRMKDTGCPLIIMGGANCYAVEDMYGSYDGSDEHAMLVDATIIGAGEWSLRQLRDVVMEGAEKSWSKEQVLRACHGRVYGFYEADKYWVEYGADQSEPTAPKVVTRIGRKVDYVALPVVKARVTDLEKVPTLEKGLVYYSGGNGGAADLEIARGCPCFCSFCQETYINKPYTERKVGTLVEAVGRARRWQGVTQANLYSFNWNHHSGIYHLIERLIQRIGRINLISNRLDVQSQDPGLAMLVKETGSMSTTVGVEGTSERMRAFLHKSLTESQILAGIKYLLSARLAEIKLFMIVSGYETEDDLAEFCALVRRLNQMRKEGGYGTQMRVSFMPLFCAPGTPLQFYSCESAWQIKRRTLDMVVNTCRANNFGFRTGAKRSEIEISQLLEMADRRLTPLTLASSIEDEYIFYGLVPRENRNLWEERLKLIGLSWHHFFREKHLSNTFPWDHLYMGVTKRFLWERYGEALAYKDDGYCLTMLRKRAVCHQCGGCQTPRHMKNIVGREVNKPVDREDLRALQRNLDNVRPARFLIRITNPMLRVVPKRFYDQALPRALMLVDDKLEAAFVEVKGNSRLTAQVNDQKDWVWGFIMMDVAFNDPSVTEEYLKSKLPAINQYLYGMEVVDVRVNTRYRVIRLDVDLALYQVDFVGANAPSYAKVRHGIEQYFRAVSSETMVRIRKDKALSIERLDSKGGSIGKVGWEELQKALDEERSDKVLVTYLDAFGDMREKVVKGMVASIDEKTFVVRAGGLRIKKKVMEMKGAFRTVEVDLEQSRIVMVSAQFTEEGTTVLFLADNKLNPYALLESMLGGKQWQYRPFPVRVLGYYNKTEERKGEVTIDLRQILRAKASGGVSQGSACSLCKGPVEIDAFTGQPYVAVNRSGACISCDLVGSLDLEGGEEVGTAASPTIPQLSA